ncbi:hypothetical protein BU17DRAFT_39845 [Hysterangium stoloniferum]|nr:hypothetical protein BU17DRAFT_39845 [Hysterangium stoloniferum]
MFELPLELIIIVFELLYYKESGAVDYASLMSCCLVCRSWATIAQPLLFRSTILSPKSDIPGLNNPRFLAHIRELEIKIDPFGISPELFAHLVVGCGRLYHLKLAASSIISLDQSVLDILLNIPQIKALTLSETNVESIVLYQLLRFTPSVRHLSLLSKVNATPPDTPPGFQLYELAVRQTPHPRVFIWLLSMSHTTLRILEMRDWWDGPTMNSIIRNHGAYLRSFRFLCYNGLVADFIRGTHNLEEIIFMAAIPRFMNDLPRTIEHFGIRNPPHPCLSTLDSFIAAIPSLPNLRIVTCNKYTTSDPQYAKLISVCMELGVELQVDYLPFDRMEDLVPCNRFPRRKSVSNFRFME